MASGGLRYFSRSSRWLWELHVQSFMYIISYLHMRSTMTMGHSEHFHDIALCMKEQSAHQAYMHVNAPIRSYVLFMLAQIASVNLRDSQGIGKLLNMKVCMLCREESIMASTARHSTLL